MSDRSEAIGLASASSACPPPNSSAAGFAMNDHVTASTMPRAASARLARPVRSCIGVSTDCAAPRRGRTASPAPCRRRRCGRSPRRCRPCHARPCARRAPRPSPRTAAGHHEAEAGEDAFHLDQGHLDAGEPLDLVDREIDQAVLAKRSPTTTFSDGVPPHISITSLVASSSPGTMKAGSTPRSKR